MAQRKRYAVVGLGSRSRMFTTALLKEYADRAQLVAYCDQNQTRMDYYNQYYADTLAAAPVPTYKPEDFERMLQEQQVDCVIVTSIDRTHHRYIIAAMEARLRRDHREADDDRRRGVPGDPRRAEARPGGKLTVTFNYRYAPRNTKVKELLQAGAIGKVISVHFEWLLDTDARRRLLPPLAPRQAQLGRADGPQGDAPLRPGQLVAR